MTDQQDNIVLEHENTTLKLKKEIKALPKSVALSEKRERKKIDYSALLADVDDYGNPVGKKSKGRPKKQDLNFSLTSSPTNKLEQSKDDSKIKKRGRPKKVDAKTDSLDTEIQEIVNNTINCTIVTERDSDNIALNKIIDDEDKILSETRKNKKKENLNETKVPSSLLDEEYIELNFKISESEDKILNGKRKKKKKEKLNETKAPSSLLDEEYVELNFKISDSEDSDHLGIKKSGRPIKKKRGRPRKIKDNNFEISAENQNFFPLTEYQELNQSKKAKILDSADQDSNISFELTGNENQEKPCLDVQSLNKEHEDLRGTKVEEVGVENQSSDSFKRKSGQISGKKGRKKGMAIAYHRKTEKICTEMLKTMFYQSEDVELSNISRMNNGETLEDGTICMVCKESVPIPHWENHKRKVHYDLAWCFGEFPIDLHDENCIYQSLKEIREECDKLECNTCGFIGTRIKDFWQHVEKCTGVISSSGMVTCAICNEAMVKNEWNNHRYKRHNNLAWRIGEPSIDLNDQNLVVHILNKLYKQRKPLTCEKCGKVVKSVVGFLSHRTICQRTQEEINKLKTACKLCKKRVLPVSMDSHMKTHSVKSVDDEDELMPALKRKAADKAMEVINTFAEVDTTRDDISQWYLTDDGLRRGVRYRYKKMKLETFKCIFPDCNEEFSSIIDCLGHLKWCCNKPVQFMVCKICLAVCNDINEITDHLKEAHSKESDIVDASYGVIGYSKGPSDFEDEESDEENRHLRKRKTAFEIKCQIINEKYPIKPDFLRNADSKPIFLKAYDWMWEFCCKHYSNENLFPNLTNETPWPLLDTDLLNKFLPKATESCDVVSVLLKNKQKFKNADLKFQKIELFGTLQLNKDDVTMFCGGPISALAWMPTPFDEQEHSEILAVAVLNDMESKYLVDCNYYEPCLIQLWDYGVLKNRQDGLQLPSLLYSIAINVGPIWHLEWCPSGCFSPEINRLGLLAVATSDSLVYIYSVDNVAEHQRDSIYKGHHCLKLQLGEDNPYSGGPNYYATRISWSKASGHNYIAVGYSNGFVALFNLGQSPTDLFRCNSINGESVLSPYLKFQPQSASYISGLTLSHLDNGNTWLLTATSDRDVCYWDLRTLNCISSMAANPNEAIWLTQWLSSAHIEDRDGVRYPETPKPGVINGAPILSSVWSPRQFMTDRFPSTMSLSTMKSLSFSDWTNTIVHGSYMGEIVATISNQLARQINSNNKLGKQIKNCLFSHATMVQKDKEVSTDNDHITSYQETDDKYGLVFSDFNLNNTNFPKEFKHVNKTVETDRDLLKDTKIEWYPFHAINKIAFNPNPQACTFLVAGYQSGLVRLKRLKFLVDLHSRL